MYTPLIPESARRDIAEQVVCLRAANERLPSEFARWPFGRRSVVARQTPCSVIARRALVGISGVVKLANPTHDHTMGDNCIYEFTSTFKG